MSQIEDPRFRVLERLEEKPRSEGDLYQDLPQSSTRIRRALGYLRERELVNVEQRAGYAKYTSNFPLDQDVETSFVNFLVGLLDTVRTIRRRPDLHEEIVQDIQVQLVRSKYLARALGDLFFDCLAGRVSCPFKIVNSNSTKSVGQARASFPVTLTKWDSGAAADDTGTRSYEEHMIVVSMN